MRIGSLCSGVGGLELGLERAGLGHTVWQVEHDPHASDVLARHWDVPNHHDLKQVEWDDVEPVDVICAGYPCQPFSTAGRRQGTDDDRHLWPAVRDAVGSLGPRLVILENVRGHISLRFDQVLGDLADLGFDAEWCLLRASDVGAPHQRARLFVAAHARGEGREGPGHAGSTRRSWSADGDDGPAPDSPIERGERDGRARSGRPGSADHGLALANTDGGGLEVLGQHDGEPLTGQDPPPGGHPDGRRSATAWGPYRPAIERWEAIHGPAPAPTVDGRLSPDFVCWMMGFPPGWVDGLTRTAALRCLGNAVVPQVAERFGRMILGDVGGGSVQPDVLLPTPIAQPSGTSAESFLARKNRDGGARTTVTDLRMIIEEVLA